MPIKNYTTTIAVSKTNGEIQQMLARHGVRQMSTHFDEDGTPSSLSFVMPTEHGPREFAMPVRIDGVLASLSEEKGVSRAHLTREHAARVAWRIARDWLDAQLALVDAQMSTAAEVMFPFMTDGNGTTAYLAYSMGQGELEV